MPVFINTSDTMGGDQAVLDALIADTLTEFQDDRITKLKQYAFNQRESLTAINLPNVNSVGNASFSGCTSLRSVSLSSLANMSDSMFSGCTSLVSVDLPSLKTTGGNGFKGCSSLQSITFPNTVTALKTYLFQNCTNLRTVIGDIKEIGAYCFSGCTSLEMTSFPNVTSVGNDVFDNVPAGVISLPACTNIAGYISRGNGALGFDLSKQFTIGSSAFASDDNMIHLILRSAGLCSLSSTGAFNGTPISVGCGYIYVPEELVDTYKAATNWSAYADQIIPLSEYPKAPSGSISDTWEQIFEAEQDGTYSSKYSIGDTKIVDIDGENILMEIVAMDTDVLSSDISRTAPITWVSKGVLDIREMNDTVKEYGGATSMSAGGWGISDMRTYLRETLFPKIESTVRTNIKEVNKTYRMKYPNDTTLQVADTVWIPSYKEVGGTGTAYEETSGVVYSCFNSNSSRVKKLGNYGVGTSRSWWLRSAVDSADFGRVTDTGSMVVSSTNEQHGLVLGFCT